MKNEEFNAEYRATLHRLLGESGKSLADLSEATCYSETTLKKIARGEMTEPVKQGVMAAFTKWFKDGGENARILFDPWQRKQPSGRQQAEAVPTPTGEVIDRSFLQKLDAYGADAVPLLTPRMLLVPPGPHELSGSSDLPDILTPGSIALLDGMLPNFPKETIERWAALGEEAIVAVEQGDFAAHITVGQRIIDEPGDVAQIRAAGYYLKAEGQRLLAGLSKDQQARTGLLEASLAEYARAADIYPHSPRAIRGAASVLEAQGHLGQALDRYAQAKGMSLEQAHTPSVRSERPLVLHEILRVTRHEIHCISEIRRTSPASAWRRVNKEGELRGYIMHSENSHHEFLAAFRPRQRWYLLEWFMALVFFGKVWGDLGDSQRMTYSLLQALKVRRLLIASNEALTNIEKANLRWWMDAALSRERTRTWGSLVPGLDSFEYALHASSDREILSAMDDLIAFITAPWEQTR